MSEDIKSCPFCGTYPMGITADGQRRMFCQNSECEFSGTPVPLPAWNRLAVLQDGEVVAPKEPTALMKTKANNKCGATGLIVNNSDIEEIWHTMIAARPKGGSQ